MKILVVSNMFPNKKHPSYGVFVKNFCGQLQELGIDYSVSVMKKSSNKISKLFRYAMFFCTTFFKCILCKYDLIYVHYASNSSIPVLWASKLKRLTVYTNVHGSDVVPQNAKQEKMQKYTKRILKISKKVIAPSQFFRAYLIEKYDVSEKNVYVSFSGGIDSNIFYPENNEPTSKKLTMGYVGRISYGKGWDVFLKACTLVKDVDFKLVIVGSGPLNEEMRMLIKELDIDDKVELYPLLNQRELSKIYNQMDVFVFSTCLRESLGLVAIEAMACGTPVIASDYAAPSYYVKDDFNGYKFEKGNEKDLADKIRKFSTLSVEKRQMLKNGALLTAREYKKENVLEQMRVILLEGDNDKENAHVI